MDAHVYFYALPIGEKFTHQGETYVKLEDECAKQLTGPATDRREWTFEDHYGTLIPRARARQLHLPSNAFRPLH